MASRKVDFALRIASLATALEDLLQELDGLADIYLASGYAPSGSNPITDEDLMGHDVTVAMLGEFCEVAVALQVLMAGGAPATGEYGEILARIRRI